MNFVKLGCLEIFLDIEPLNIEDPKSPQPIIKIFLNIFENIFQLIE